MRKYIFIILILSLFPSISFADTLSSSVSWNSTTWTRECGVAYGNITNHTSSSFIHYWIPSTNRSNAWTTWGTIPCIAHNYVLSSEYRVTTKYSKDSIAVCPTWERIVKIDYYRWNNRVAIRNIWWSPFTWAFDSYYIYCQNFSDKAPSISNIATSIAANLLADNNYSYKFTLNRNETLSPWEIRTKVSRVEIRKENIDNENLTNSVMGSAKCITTWGDRTTHNTTCTEPWNISKVDNFRQTNWWRQYTFTITKICDSAWNCTSGTKTFNYNVFANTINANTTTNTTTDLSSNNNIADWSTKHLTLTLKDKYNNAIIPASEINRSITLKYDVENTMYLNQVLRIGNSSIFWKAPNQSSFSNTNNLFTTWNKTITLNPSNYSWPLEWNYKFEFQAYTPTANQSSGQVSDKDAKFNISWLKFSVSSNLSTPVWVNPSDINISWWNIVSRLNPIYYTEFSWEITDEWIFEWGTQNSRITIKKNNTSINPNTQELQLSFGSTEDNKYELYAWDSVAMARTNQLSDTPTKIQTINPNFPINSSSNVIKNLYSRLIEKDIAQDKKVYIASHIKYNLNWNEIIYNSWIVWKDSYYWDYTDDIVGQEWVKVDGITHSESDNEIVDEQFQNDVVIIEWNIDRLTTRAQIIKNWYEAAKNLGTYKNNNPSPYILTNINTPNNNIRELNNVIVFWDEDWAKNEIFTIWNWSEITITKNKTIVAIWWNIYINSNITWTWMLWIIALKDKEWKWWNIYINPSVTQINWILFAEKSVISYDWTKELDWSTETYVLRNQLYIHWTLFSENTIWGSREDIPRCPIYVNTNDCSLEEAQKYDLNYLRRYFLKADWNPANWWTKVTQKEEYKKYPVIIEYNPRILISPPPLFGQN